MRNVCFKKSLVVGIIVLLVSIGIMPLAGSISINKYVVRTGSYGVDLFCDEPYKNVKQGDTATFVVEITNIGTLDDTYDVIAGSIEDIICKVNGVNADQFNPYEFTLMPGESTTFEVTAEVWESVPVGEWDVIVETRSQNDTEVYDELILTANVQKKIKAVSDIGEDCGCQTVNRVDLLRFKLLLIRVEVITNIILSKFGHIPEVEEKCQDILDIIHSSKVLDYPIICSILEIIGGTLSGMMTICVVFIATFPITSLIFGPIWVTLLGLVITISVIGIHFDC